MIPKRLRRPRRNLHEMSQQPPHQIVKKKRMKGYEHILLRAEIKRWLPEMLQPWKGKWITIQQIEATVRERFSRYRMDALSESCLRPALRELAEKGIVERKGERGPFGRWWRLK